MQLRVSWGAKPPEPQLMSKTMKTEGGTKVKHGVKEEKTPRRRAGQDVPYRSTLCDAEQVGRIADPQCFCLCLS